MTSSILVMSRKDISNIDDWSNDSFDNVCIGINWVCNGYRNKGSEDLYQTFEKVHIVLLKAYFDDEFKMC